jgi:hypothetical protein
VNSIKKLITNEINKTAERSKELEKVDHADKRTASFSIIVFVIIAMIIRVDVSFGTYLIVTFLGIIAVVAINRKKILFHLKTINKKVVFYGLVFGVITFAITLTVTMLSGPIAVEDVPVNEATSAFTDNAFLLFVAYFVSTPLVDEVVLRANIKTLIKNVYVFFIVSACCTWLVYFDLSITGIAAFAKGLMCAIAYVRGRNIFTPYISIAFSNAIALLIDHFIGF